MAEELLVRPYAAYHEAGHAVVSLALGLKVNRVWIDERGVGCTESHSEAHLHPHLLRTKAERLAAAREVLAIHVAGHVANHLRDQRAWFGRWPTRREIRERPITVTLPELGAGATANYQWLEAALRLNEWVPIEPGHAITVDVGRDLTVYEIRSPRSPRC